MANRPTEPRKWAEGSNAETSEPQAERSTGYKQDERLPHDQFNWLVQNLFDWTDYLDEKFNRSNQLIDLVEAIGVNVDESGEAFFNGSTAGSIIEVIYGSSNGDTKWTSDILEAVQYVLADVIRPTNGDVIDVEDSAGNSEGGIVRLSRVVAQSVLRSDGRVDTDIIRSLANDTVVFEDDTGSGNQATVDCKDTSAINTAKAWGCISPDDANSNDPTINESYNISSVVRDSDGTYNVSLSISAPSTDKMTIHYGTRGRQDAFQYNITTKNIGGDFTISVVDDTATSQAISNDDIYFSVYFK